MQGFGRSKYRRLLIIVLLLLVASFAATGVSPTSSYFSSETISGNYISFSTWGPPPPQVCKVCPCFGVSGICAWAVFLYGTNLGQVSSIKLVKGSTVVIAKKVWHFGDGILYCIFDMRKVPTGTYDIVVTTSSGTDIMAFTGFKILTWTCFFSAVNPENPATFKLNMKNDDPNYLIANLSGYVHTKFTSVSLVSDGTRIDGTVDCITIIGCRVKFARANVPLGTYDLIVNRADGSSLLLENSFIVQQYVSPMKVLGVGPNSGLQGQKVKLKVSGVRLDMASNVTLVQGSLAIQPTAPMIKSTSQITVTFNLTSVPAGLCDLDVSCSDGTQAILYSCFTVVGKNTVSATQQPLSQSVNKLEQQSAPYAAPSMSPVPVVKNVTPLSAQPILEPYERRKK